MSTTTAWAERPREEANLLNPAFLAQLIERIATGYRERTADGLPWPLILIALPVVLHRPTRAALPATISTSMAVWTQRNPLLVASLAPRARSLCPLVKEALMFGLAHGTLKTEGATLQPPSRRAQRKRDQPWREPTEDFRQCMTRATFFGRWCEGAGSPATVFALWGVRP